MKVETRDRLLTALSQFLAAQSAGTTRFVISDSYLSVDNYFSALLLHKGIASSHNHKKKLEAAWHELGSDLMKYGVTKKELEDFYQLWQDVRYSSKTPLTAEAIRYRRVTHYISKAVVSIIASDVGRTVEDIAEELYAELLGASFTAIDEKINDIREDWQSELEYMGEIGFGSKLGNKLANPANYSEISVFVDDTFTRKILAENKDVVDEFGALYHKFLKIIDRIRMQRLLDGKEPRNSPEFNLSVRLQYESESVEAEANRWAELIVEALRSIKPNKL